MMTGRILLILALGLGPALSGCQLHGKPHVARSAAHRISLAPAAAAPAPAVAGDIIAPGVVEPWGGEVELSAQEPGWIATIAIREGETVRSGQLLATLEDGAQQRALDLARAELDQAEAGLAKIEHGATPEELRQAQADCDAAAARRDFARATAARMDSLKESGSVSKAEWERTASEATALAAVARQTSARMEELTRGARAEDRDAARARVEAARAGLRLAEANLARRRIIAPAAGTILLSRFHAGEFYAPADGPLFALGDLSRLQVRLEVDEIDASDAGVGAPCTLYSDEETPVGRGTVVRLAPRMGRRALAIESPTARADVRVREVFVAVPSTARLVPGQRVWGHTPRATGRIPA